MESTYQKHLSDLNELAALIQSTSEMAEVDLSMCDVDSLKRSIQANKVSLKPGEKNSAQVSTETSSPCFQLFCQDTESNVLRAARLRLEDATFDIQCFISEHAQFLSPAQSSLLLKLLSTTQRAVRDQTEKLATQRSTLDVLLDTREKENQEKVCLWISDNMSQMFS